MKSEWKECTIADLGDVVTGKTPSTKASEFWDGAINFVTPKDIQGLKHITKTERRITEAGLQKVKGAILPPQAVCVSCIGNIGYTGMTSQRCVSNQQINSIIVNDDNDPDFVYYLIRNLWPFFKSYEGQSTTLSILNKTQFSKISVTVPDKTTQIRIAAILSSIDEKIAINTQINDNLQQQAQAIFMQRFITDEIDGDEKPLYDFADYINGAAFKPSECGDHGLPIIKIVELKNGITDSTKYFDGFKGEKYLIQDKDILFSWSGNPDTSIDIFIWTHGKAILNQHTFNVRSNTGHRWFTFLMLKYFKPEFSRIASNKQTTGLGHVTATDLKRLTFIFNEDAIEAFEHEVSPFMETIYSNMMENQRLAQLRDTLLPKLMSGAIDVSGIPL